MKVWMKLLLGSALGLVIGFLFPLPVREEPNLLLMFSDFILSLGRYAVFPLVFFSAAVGINELRRDKKLGAVVWRTLGYMIVATTVLVILGALFILIFHPEPIRTFNRHEIPLQVKGWSDLLQNLIPKNVFQVFTGSADFLLPLYVLSFILGLHFNFDRDVTQPAVNLFDSLSRIFYHINSFIVEIMGFGIIVLSGAWLAQLRQVQDLLPYIQLIIVLAAATLVVILGAIPALLFFFGNRENPYKWIFATLGSGITAFFSGDTFFSLSFTSRLTRENLGVPRRVGAVNLPFLAMFGRAGTAMTTTIAFFIILKSFSALDITAEQILWTIPATILLSLAVPSVPGLGAYINLALLCGFYGKGLENGMIMLQPVIPLLVSFSTLLDVYVASLTSMLVARHTGQQKQVNQKLYI